MTDQEIYTGHRYAKVGAEEYNSFYALCEKLGDKHRFPVAGETFYASVSNCADQTLGTAHEMLVSCFGRINCFTDSDGHGYILVES